MLPLNYALAVALLTGLPETSGTEVPATTEGVAVQHEAQPETFGGEFATVRPTLRDLAISWEILDSREVRYVLTRQEDFGADLKLLRRRYQDLFDAPPLSDAVRFPDRAFVNELLSFNRAYRQHLDNSQALSPIGQWDLHEALQEVDRLYQIWDTVRDARCDYYYITVRRQALKKLREMIGLEAYYNGTLPPHVPVWRFARID
jgi:hypothetical protein